MNIFVSKIKRMDQIKIHQIIRITIGLVWLVNGLYCKLLSQVPRHQEIVSEILGVEQSHFYTRFIGVLEILMAIWILSDYRSNWHTYLQILVVTSMNILEFILVPDLLLWGHYNIVFAFIFLIVVYVNEFYLKGISQRRSVWDI